VPKLSLSRSLGIPARTVVANWYQGAGHVWSELYLPPYGWVPVDTSGAQLVQNGLKGQIAEEKVLDFMKPRGIPTRDPSWLFGHLYPNRLEVFVGPNVVFQGKALGSGRTFQMMQPAGKDAAPEGIVFEGLSKTTVSAGFFLFDAESGDAQKARDRADEELATAYLSAKVDDRAIAGFKKTLARKPKDAQTLFHLGNAYVDLKKWPEAAGTFRLALAGEGGGSVRRTLDTWSHILLGMCLDAQAQRQEAIKEYQAALAIGADFSGSIATAKNLLEKPFDPEEQK